MMTTNFFVIANVKQLWIYIALEFYCLFSEHLEGVGVLNSAISNSFHNQFEFGTILEGLPDWARRDNKVAHCDHVEYTSIIVHKLDNKIFIH